LQSTATTGACAVAGEPDDEDEAPGAKALAVVVIVVVIVRRRRHDLTARVEAAHRANPVRAARAVTLRTRVDGGREDLVLRPPLRGTAV